jgi:hypothetical protein
MQGDQVGRGKRKRRRPAITELRDRVVEVRKMDPAELAPNPKNWRRHPAEQQRALRAIFDRVGFAGVLLARIAEDGTPMLIDGHARQELIEGVPVHVAITDLSEAEADELLAVYDPIGAMADTDERALQALAAGLAVEDESLAALIARTAGTAPVSTLEQSSQLDGALTDETKVYGGCTSYTRGSGPWKYWRQKGLIVGKVLDFGCGKDSQNGVVGYDAFARPDPTPLLERWDTVVCNYVLNVQPSDHLVVLLAFVIRGLLRPNGHALFALRNDLDLGRHDTPRGFQVVKPAEEWRALLRNAFEVKELTRDGFIGLLATPLQDPGDVAKVPGTDTVQ